MVADFVRNENIEESNLKEQMSRSHPAGSKNVTGASEVTHQLTHQTGILPDLSGLDLKVKIYIFHFYVVEAFRHEGIEKLELKQQMDLVSNLPRLQLATPVRSDEASVTFVLTKFKRKLSSMKTSYRSIMEVANYVGGSAVGHDEMAEYWLDSIGSGMRKTKIALFYLVSEIIQLAHKKKIRNLKTSFKNVMYRSLSDLRGSIEDVCSKCFRKGF